MISGMWKSYGLVILIWLIGRCRTSCPWIDICYHPCWLTDVRDKFSDWMLKKHSHSGMPFWTHHLKWMTGDIWLANVSGMAHVPMPSDAQCLVPLITVIATGRLQQRVEATWKARHSLGRCAKGSSTQGLSIAFGFPKHTTSIHKPSFWPWYIWKRGMSVKSWWYHQIWVFKKKARLPCDFL